MDLIFFNNNGDALNFNYNTASLRYEGDVIFDINGNDTFKTEALYLCESVPAFQYQNPPNLFLQKFQLFNEFGFNFFSGTYTTQSVTLIEPVNNEPDYYSKWVYGTNFQSMFPIGSSIRFNESIFEFINSNQIYCVVETKTNAILIISLLDNQSFQSLYGASYSATSSYVDITISGVDMIGIYNYISPSLATTLSPWNEPDFYQMIYLNRKLNVVNSNNNNGLFTILNPDLIDFKYFQFGLSYTNLPVDEQLFIEVITKTDLPQIYSGPLTFTSSVIEFGFNIPTILSPGTQFRVTNSVLNNLILTIGQIPTFLGNVNLTYYATGSQTLWNNQIYQCIQGYTWSGASTVSITPASASYWGSPTYLPIQESINYEFISVGNLFLTTDHFYFTQSYTQSSIITLASAAQNFESDLASLNISLTFSNNILEANLLYPYEYADVSFYYNQVSSTYSIGYNTFVYERIIETYESINQENNQNLSSNFSYNIVFTNLDGFGVIITINKMVYQAEIAWVYTSGILDITRTIDLTLRNWLVTNFVTLLSLGIIATLKTIGYASVYYNSINISTQFPNVPIDFTVEVGTTANFYIQDYLIIFYNMGSYMSLTINDIIYGITFSNDIPTTLLNWYNSYQNTLYSYGIGATAVASSLSFDTISQTQPLSISVNVGQSALPGVSQYLINNQFTGNEGCLITSDSVILGSTPSIVGTDFITSGFATGMVSSVNATYYPLQNVEYNIVYLDPYNMNFSYEGPFWGTTNSICNSSAFTTVAFTIGYGQTGCPEPIGEGGMFNLIEYADGFSLNFQNSNTYSVSNYDGVAGMVDILYVQPVNSIYVLGDNIVVFDSVSGNQFTSINLGITNSIALCFNSISNYLFALSSTILYQIDPFINQIISTFSFSYNANSISLNTTNGDIYVSFDTNLISVFPVNSLSNPIIITTGISQTTYDMVYSNLDNIMYVVTGDGNTVLNINTINYIIQFTYSIPGLRNSILYEQSDTGVYVCGSSDLYKIYNNAVATVSSIGQTFSNLLFNNLTQAINVSSDISYFSLDIASGSVNYSSNIGAYGYQVINQFDGDIYLSDQINNQVLIINPSGYNGGVFIINALPMSAKTTKIIYDPDAGSVWLIQPSVNNVIQIQISFNNYIDIINPTQSISVSTDAMYGTLDPNYIVPSDVWLNVREYLRRPRENFMGNPTVSLYYCWYSDNVPQFFLYDFSGTQLQSNNGLTYTGPIPLTSVYLNSSPNTDPNQISNPIYQQTIFATISNSLDFIDDIFDISNVPDPIELFVGFNSQFEGPLRSILQLKQHVDVNFTISPTNGFNIVSFETLIDTTGTITGITGATYGQISLDQNSTYFFTTDSMGNPMGLQVGQNIAIIINDITNDYNLYISQNNGFLVQILQIYSRTLTVNFLNPSVDYFTSESTLVNNYPATGSTTYLSCQFIVWDQEIGRFNVYGQTEVEDIRYHIQLNNIGKLISSDDVYIFSEYDINEQGIDWVYLNQKRKEMLMMKNIIYPYIGSYKSIINAINYFGYNDLQLYEYYRNINPNSPNFDKLFKVEIPDIFDNSVDGWTDNDYLKHTFPNPNYEDTNLFNLTYLITDIWGNNLLTYSVEEVQIKLEGLKYWLESNIIPITHKILDITGRADFVEFTTISHQTRKLSIFNTCENFTPVISNLTEAYLMPVSNGSTVYNCLLSFTLSCATSSYGTFSLIPDYYTIDIKTYEIYREWYPFTNYMNGNCCIYYGNLYESVIDNNETNNPLKYSNSSQWRYGNIYNVGDIVQYDSDFYIYTAQGFSASAVGSTFSPTASLINPFIDTKDWLDITEWKQVNMLPIQKISEYRNSNNILPFNFTIDSNIDPFIVVEVSSDNGYGGSYFDRKNYDINGILNLVELEQFANLTVSQYRAATLPVVFSGNS